MNPNCPMHLSGVTCDFCAQDDPNRISNAMPGTYKRAAESGAAKAPEADLQTLCAEWQKILRLQDWNVTVVIKRLRDMGHEAASGRCEYNQALKVAAISIVDPIDYDPEWMEPVDVEEDLVHELEHIHFAPFFDAEPNSPRYIAMEQAIEMNAKALVALKRRK